MAFNMLLTRSAHLHKESYVNKYLRNRTFAIRFHVIEQGQRVPCVTYIIFKVCTRLRDPISGFIKLSLPLRCVALVRHYRIYLMPYYGLITTADIQQITVCHVKHDKRSGVDYNYFSM